MAVVVTLLLQSVFKRLKKFRASFLENYNGHMAYEVITKPYKSLKRSIEIYAVVLILAVGTIAISSYLLFS
jgi:hypothetical protein